MPNRAPTELVKIATLSHQDVARPERAALSKRLFRDHRLDLCQI